MSKVKIGLTLLGIILLLAGMAVFTTFYLYQNIYLTGLETPAGKDGVEERFVVEFGQSFYKVSLNLEKAGLIEDHRILRIFARLNPDKTGIQAGEYMLSRTQTPMQIIDTLLKGEVITYSVTFPEGLTIKEMADVWAASGYGTAKAFLTAVDQYSDSEWELPDSGWEGYLFPETYTFTREFTENELVHSMIKQLKAVMRPEWLTAASELGLSRHEVLTLASLIEKETRLNDEHGLVSSVFHNRLKKGMLLQCDPTVIYALGDQYKGRLFTRHLKVDSPYNTYLYPDLPPGPIASPGKKAIAAACFPADSRYYYFVADNTGGHRFSRTLSEHNKAVRDYREGLKRK